MKPHFRNKLSTKILLVLITLSLVPVILFGLKFVKIASTHMDKDINVWEKINPAYVEQAREFHAGLKERLNDEVSSYAIYSSFIAVILALLTSGILLRPLRNLTEGAKQLGSGNMDYRLVVRGSDEIAQLATAFNAMADSLQSRNQELLRKELYIEKMLDPMWVLDQEDRIFDINPAFTRQFAYAKEKIIGSSAREFFDAANLEIFDQQMREKRDLGKSDVYEIAIRTGRTRNIPVLVSCTPIMTEGRVTGKIGVFKDISTRKELEDDIFLKNKELYALNSISAITSQSMDLEDILLNTVKEVTVIIGMDAGGIYLAHDETRELTCAAHIGVPEHMVKQMARFNFGEDIPGFVAINGSTIAIPDVSVDVRVHNPLLRESGLKGYLCLPLKSKDRVQGVLCLLSSAVHAFTQSELEFLESVGHIVGMAIENIKLYNRERSRLASMVSFEKNRAEAILSSIAEGVYTTDRDLRITYWNKAAEAITGFRSEDVVGRLCSDVLHHENELGECLCGDRCLMKPGTERAEGRALYCAVALGNKLPIALTSAPIRDADGSEYGRVNIFRDITREHEIDRMKTDFVRTVSHELRTPLSAIVGMTEMLIDGEVRDAAAARDYLNTIHTEGRRLTRMVEELLDVAKIESGRLGLRKEPIAVRPIIDHCIHILEPQASSRNIDIRCDVPDDSPAILADREKFHQVVFNLLSNALYYSNNEAHVAVSSSLADGCAVIKFEDTGWGIPEQDLPHIFKKFYRSKVHAPLVKGTGLGLPLVLDIVKAHGGEIDVKSVPGKGSIFTLFMPLAKDA